MSRINENIIKAVLKVATVESKDEVLKLIINSLLSNDYYGNKAAHVLEMLVDDKSIITAGNVNINYIKEHPDLLLWNHNDYDIKNIHIKSINNIEGFVSIDFEAKRKTDENEYAVDSRNISFLENKEILY